MIDLSATERHYPDLLLWILLLGKSGISLLGGPNKPWCLSLWAGMQLSFGFEVPSTVSGLKYF